MKNGGIEVKIEAGLFIFNQLIFLWVKTGEPIWVSARKQVFLCIETFKSFYNLFLFLFKKNLKTGAFHWVEFLKLNILITIVLFDYF